MTRSGRSGFFLLLALGASGGLAAAMQVEEKTVTAQLSSAAALAAPAREFFQANCVRCHGPAKSKAGLRLDQLAWDPTDEESLARWQEVRDKLLAGEMPPEEEPRPEPRAVEKLCADIRAAFVALAEDPAQPRVLRRLNRTQYRNTLRDLLAIDVRLEDPTSSFPPDDTLEGFDVLAEGLVMSDFLMRQYLMAARRALDMAIFEGPRPEPRTFRMSDRDARPGNFTTSDGRFHGRRIQNNPRESEGPVLLFLNDERAPGETIGQVLTTSLDGAAVPGWYQFHFEVESKDRGNLPEKLRTPVQPDWQPVHQDDLHRLEIYFSAPNGSSPPTGRRRILADAVDLPDDERVVIDRRYWLAPGWRLELAFGNAYAGPVDFYLSELGAAEEVKERAKLSRAEQLAYPDFSREYVLRARAPRIVFHDAAESGPCYESWPPPSQVAALGDPAAPLEERVAAFATRAFRRPVTAEELAPYVRLAREGPEGLRTALEAILCSPRFLYFLEESRALDDWALASRLSYFLWSTLPDDELRSLATAGRLRDPGVLRAQAERMLADPRSQEFVEQFTWCWLGLQNMLDMAPDPMRFPDYYGGRLREAGLTEARTFFREVLDGNLPLSEFIVSDHTFVNADLARHYGLEGVHTTATFQRVALPAELRRGGLLGQAVVLTTSANGVDTSPVVRGVWVLDRLLGTPPDRPPPDIPIPEPDTRGELTIRQIFEKHRSSESCNQCHRSIDPLGNALESFDAIGRWRDAYESGAHIDPSGRMPDGATFDDVTGLRRELLNELPLFTRNLTRKLAAYAAGRELRAADRLEIDRLVAAAGTPGAGLRDLILSVVTSRTFRER
jgi:mono/diheme cytochrome c family protein